MTVSSAETREVTDFEQQVAEALRCDDDFIDGLGAIWIKRDDIVPRIAAAIRRTAGRGFEHMPATQKAALAALRGEMS